MINGNNKINLFLLKLMSKNKYDLTVRQLIVLIELKHKKYTVSELATNLEMSLPLISRVANKLHRYGWVVRMPNPDDKRSVFVQITSAGKQFLTECGL